MGERGQNALETRRQWRVFDSRTTCACPPGTAPAPMGDASTPQAVLCFVHVRIGEAPAPCNCPVTPRTLCLSSALGGGGVLASMGHRDAPSHRHSVQQACVCPWPAPSSSVSLFPPVSVCWGSSQSHSSCGVCGQFLASPGLWLHPSHQLHMANSSLGLHIPSVCTFVEGQQSHCVGVTLTAPF